MNAALLACLTAMCVASTADVDAPNSSAPPSVQRAQAALDEGELQLALSEIEGATGPFHHHDWIAVLELKGTIRALAGLNDKARGTFTQLLLIAPEHKLSYTLSPRVTHIVEEARRDVEKRARFAYRLQTPLASDWDTPINLFARRASDPLDLVDTIRVCWRRKGSDAPAYVCENKSVGADGDASFSLPPQAADGTGVQLPVLQIAMTALDASGNEVLVSPSASSPVEIPLGLAQEVPWHENPVIVGGALLIGGLVGVVVVVAAVGGGAATWAFVRPQVADVYMESAL